MSSDDHSRVDERSHGGVEDPRDRYAATDSFPSFPQHEESIDYRERSIAVEGDVYFDGKPYVPEDESTSKDKYGTVCEKMEDLTESEIGEIHSRMIEYIEGGFVECLKGKVEDIKEKRLRKTKGNTKLSFPRTVVENEAEAPSSDLSTSEFKLVLHKVA